METQTNTVLRGQFLEFCDCYTICPCWVNETPDEEHCSALYLWHFDPDCRISGVEIGGKSLAMAAFHARRRGTQSAIYVDKTLPAAGKALLLEAFSGRPSGDTTSRLDPGLTTALAGLKRLLGEVVQTAEARIVLVAPEPEGCGPEQGWQVTVCFEDEEGNRTTLARAHYREAIMKGQEETERPNPLTLNNTALHDELKIEGAVVVQRVERFEFDVASLPTAPFVLKARSGMSARFDYTPPSA